MAIDKSLYTLPEGMDDLTGGGLEDEGEIEITFATEDGMMGDVEFNPDGSAEIMLEEDNTSAVANAPFDANLAEYLDETDLNILSNDLTEDVEADITSRKDWMETFVAGLDVLGFKYEERTEPWEKACGAYSSVLAEAIIGFQSETIVETFPAAGPVKTKILGEETKEKEEAAARVQADMNYQLTEVMEEYRSEHERMLYGLGLSGSAFKKVYFDPTKQRQVSLYVSSADIIVPYGASHIATAERLTHVMRKTKNEVKKLQAVGFYRDVDLGEPEPYHTDIEEHRAKEGGYVLSNDDNRYTLYEVVAELTIPGVDDEDELPKPYVVTIERSSGEVLAIRRNWVEGDDLYLPRQHFVHYPYIPGDGFYGLGLVHIVGGYARTGTSLIRQLVDAGTLSNLPGGLKARGMRIKGDDSPVRPGEFKDVDIPSGNIRDNIMPLPYKEPSQVLLALLERITQEGRRMSAVAEINASDMSANAPVGTTLAILERTLKPMTAIQARIHNSMKQEFKLLKAIIAEEAPEDYDYEPERSNRRAKRSDYDMVEVIPVSDPNSSTMAQRVVQYQTVHQLSTTAPQIYNLPQLHRQMIEVLGVKNADKIIPTRDDATPKDPVSENMDALTGQPMRAFIYQDHDAHIATHTAFIQDPMVAQVIGQNPQAQQIMASIQAHIAEHLGFTYRKQIEERLGVPLPPPHEQLPEEIEVQLSRLIADAGKQLTQAHQQQAAQQQAQQQMQDPMFQLEMQKLQVQAQEVQRKAQKDQMDLQAKMAELQRKAKKDQMDAMIDVAGTKLDEKELQLEAQKTSAQMAASRRESAVKTDLELVKTIAMDRQQQRQAEIAKAKQATQTKPKPKED